MEQPGDELDTAEQVITATTQTAPVVSAMESEEASLGGITIVGVEPVTGTVFDLHIGAKAKWEADVTTDVTWDSDKVRQGQQLEVARKVALATGKVGVLWTVTGNILPAGGLINIDIGEIPIGVDVTGCAPKFDENESAYECEAETNSISLIDTPGLPGSPYVNLSMVAKFTIDPANGITHRSFFIGNEEQVAAADLDLTIGSHSEQFAMPCSKPAGENVQYVLDPIDYSPGVTALQHPKLAIGIRDPFAGAIQLDPIWAGPWGIAIQSSPDLSMTGAGDAVDFGELQANNVVPVIAPLGPFAGNEGSPVDFSASVTSACPITSYVWQFSDGTTSYGPTPKRSFGDDGQFDGQLTVKDSTNMEGSSFFGVSIANLPPVPNAGPDTSEMWGKPINFQGQAVDPGSVDQATLQYSWDFGDGTPGIGGANVNHSYAQPGNYIATLTVCDDHVCTNDKLNVNVRKRNTSLAYTGANTGTYSAPAQLAASLVDELGKPVPGASIAFVLAGVAAGSAQTSISGAASRSVDVNLAAGNYPVEAGFAGTSLYEASQTAEQFEVARMATNIAYTGSVKSGPNKTVTLSAKLTDNLGRALAGKQVMFELGSQQASATTGANGVASTSLKLAQKNGQYPLTASWTPAAGDDAKWTGSATNKTFTIGQK